MRSRALVLAATLIGAPLRAADSTGALEARAVDDASGVAVEGAAVALEPGHRSGATGADGRWTFSALPPGVYRLEISHVAYVAARRPAVTVEPGATTRVEVRLARSSVRETVVVRARVPGRSGDAPAGTLSADEMSDLPGTLGDPVRGLTTAPGVASINDFKGDVRIHGAEPGDTAYRMDGVTIEGPFHFRFARASISGFNPAAFDSFEARTTSLAPSVGDTVSGVIDLSPTERGESGEFVDASIGTLAAAAAGGGPLAGGSWVAAGRYSSLALYRDLYDVRTLSVPVFWDLVLRGRTRIAPGTDLVVGSLVLGSGLSSYDAKDGSSTDMSGASRSAYAGLDAALPRGLRLTARLSGELSSERALSSEGDDLTALEHRLGLAVDLAGGEPERPTWRIGLEHAALDGTYRGSLQYAGLADPLDARATRTGAHAGVVLEPASHLTLEAGARVDRDSRYGAGPVEPRLSATYASPEGWSARISADRYAQYPRFEDAFLAQGAPLAVAVADELSAGATLDVSREIRLDLTAFARRLRDLSAETVNRLPDMPEPVGRFDRGDGRGLDLAVRKDGGRVRSRLALSLLRARETRDGVDSPTNGDQPYRLDLTASWLVTPRWDLAARFQAASGLPLSTFVPAGDGERVLGPLNGARLPAYGRLDLRTSWDLAWWKARGRLFVEIENLLGRVNVRGRDLRYDPIGNRYYYHEETGMPRVPAFGLEVSWGG